MKNNELKLGEHVTYSDNLSTVNIIIGKMEASNYITKKEKMLCTDLLKRMISYLKHYLGDNRAALILLASHKKDLDRLVYL